MKRSVRILLLLATLVCVLAAVTVLASATELKTGIGIVESGGLRLRAKPNTDAEILTMASKNDNVVVIRQVDDWYLVDYNLEIGYMSADHITFKEREDVELGRGRINTAAVNMRARPSSDSDLMYQLPYGETARIIGFNCGWYKVQYNGEYGYVRSDLMELTEKPLWNSDGVGGVGGTGGTSSLTSQIVDYAMQYLGTPYVWGGTKPSGFDCSGFTKYVYGHFGVNLKRTAAQQLTCGCKVSNLQSGDLVFFSHTYSTSAAASHVGIYIGNNEFIHAAGSRVKITSLSDGYYQPRYIGARRIV